VVVDSFRNDPNHWLQANNLVLKKPGWGYKSWPFVVEVSGV